MADNTERIEFALRQEIERTRGYVNPRKFLSFYDLDVQTRESIVTKVSMSKNIVSASGMLRYLKVDKELLTQLVKLMDLNQNMVDLSSLFDANGPEMERLGIQNSQEVRSILEKYVRLTPTAITTKVRSSEIIEAMNNAGVDEDVDHFPQSNEEKPEEVKDPIEETTSMTMDEAIMDCLTNDYKSIEKILKESMSKYNNPIHPASIVKLMDNTECVVRKMPDGYRIVNITRDDLIVLLKEAGMKIGFNQSAIAVIFNAVNKDCFEKDVRSQDELNQLITKILPELTNNISSRVDLSNPLIYDGSVERKVHFITDNDKTKQTTKRFAKLDEADYPVIRKKLIDLMSSYEPMSFSVIRSRLISEYSPQEMRDELESMYLDGLVFKKNDNTYRLHPTFSKEDIQGVISRFSSCIISVSRIYAETFIDLKKVGIVSPSELKEVMVLCDNARTIDERYNLISFDDRDPVDFIMECYEKETDKGAFAARMLREYGIPNEIIYSTVKENKGDVLFGVTSSDRKGLVDLRPSFQDKELYSKISELNSQGEKARMLAGFAWDWSPIEDGLVEDVSIPECSFSMPWNSRKNSTEWAIRDDMADQIGCIHTSQGLEFDYVGVIIGNDLKYDPISGNIYASYDDYKDGGGKKGLKDDPERLTQFVKQIYKVLMTRGMKGCFVYVRNPELRNYLKSRYHPNQ